MGIPFGVRYERQYHRYHQGVGIEGVEQMKLTLRALRVNADLRLKEAADLIGVSRYTLRNYELGRRTPNLGTFLRMCRL